MLPQSPLSVRLGDDRPGVRLHGGKITVRSRQIVDRYSPFDCRARRTLSLS